jgi:hypothetical protein
MFLDALFAFFNIWVKYRIAQIAQIEGYLQKVSIEIILRRTLQKEGSIWAIWAICLFE